MRTIAVAAPPRPFLWQAAFTCKTYTAQSPIIWQHVFVSDAPMHNGRNLLRLKRLEHIRWSKVSKKATIS
jgi:hypothetical protein